MENNFYHNRLPPLNVTILLRTCVGCVMGATPMVAYTNWKPGERWLFFRGEIKPYEH